MDAADPAAADRPAVNQASAAPSATMTGWPIGGASLTSGAPGSLLLRFVSDGKAVPASDRTWLAVTLTLQTFSGAILGIAAEAFLALGLIVYVMPRSGLDLLDLARAVAAFDLPARIGQLLAGAF